MKHFIANSKQFEVEILINPNGFREYDTRWLFPQQINMLGMQKLGAGIGTIIHQLGKSPDIVVGHDYRSYSASIKQALILGLITAGCRVKDIGLCLSPTAYFAQFELNCPSVAMVTASHNENGWTGVKIGASRPLTFQSETIQKLKKIVLEDQIQARAGGSYEYFPHIKNSYISDLIKDDPISTSLKVVVACGNGTAGAFAPIALRGIGCEVIEMDCSLDYNFPRYHPNPENLEMLSQISKKVKETGSDLGFGFDGDGDRCGIVDHTGDPIFADKIGVILSRYLAGKFKNAVFVADIKSTSIFENDPKLRALGARTIYSKTGHSYIKDKVSSEKALAGYEKSGHFVFSSPIGRGYDDGLLAAITVCRMMDDLKGLTLRELSMDLPKTWASPTLYLYCEDLEKYDVIDKIKEDFKNKVKEGKQLLGLAIQSISTIDGVRISLEDGSWGLVRASSNKPALVIVAESPISEQHTDAIVEVLTSMLLAFSCVIKL